MTELTLSAGSRPLFSPEAIARFRAYEPRFFDLAVIIALTMLPTGFAAYVDGREFLGTDNWSKPLKFDIALVVYLLTLVFFARFISVTTRAKRWYRIYSGIVVTAIVLELAWIAGAAALGTSSHFNTTPLGGVFYSIAGLGALILTTPSAVYAWLIHRNRQAQLSPVLKESLVIGLGLVLPLTLMTAGTMSALGSHFVGGAPTDAGGLFFFGWARDGGDLRVAHFFGTHALHFVPLAGLAYAWLTGGTDRWPVRLFAFAYVAFVVFLFVQALMGQPFLAWLG